MCAELRQCQRWVRERQRVPQNFFVRKSSFEIEVPPNRCVKTTQLIFTKFGGKVAHEPRKKPLDFRDNPDLDRNPGNFNIFIRIRLLGINVPIKHKTQFFG